MCRTNNLAPPHPTASLLCQTPQHTLSGFVEPEPPRWHKVTQSPSGIMLMFLMSWKIDILKSVYPPKWKSLDTWHITELQIKLIWLTFISLQNKATVSNLDKQAMCTYYHQFCSSSKKPVNWINYNHIQYNDELIISIWTMPFRSH